MINNARQTQSLHTPFTRKIFSKLFSSVFGSTAVDPTMSLDFVNGRYAINGTEVPFPMTFQRSTSATYVTSAGVLTTALANIPRIDHNPVTLEPLGILMEGARTNSVLHSSGFSAIGGATANFNSIGINGSLSMTTYTEDLNSGQHFALSSNVNTTTPTTYVISAVVQYVDLPLIQLFPSASASSTDTYANFNISTGVATSLGAGGIASGIESYGNGFYRIWLKFLSTGTGGGAGVVVAGILTPNGTRAENYTGSGRRFRVGFPQHEAGDYMSSIISTAGVAATRSLDLMSLLTSGIITQGIGTFVAEFDINQDGGDVFPCVVSMTDGSANNAITIYLPDSTKLIRGQVKTGGVTEFEQGISPAYVPKTVAKAALAYETDNARLCANGTLSSTDALVAVPMALTTMFMGNGGVSSPLFGHLRKLYYYPIRATDVEMQQVTT